LPAYRLVLDSRWPQERRISAEALGMTTKDQPPCVVVAEDQDDSRSALARLLARSGFVVHSAATVAEAAELAARHGCDLLISDLCLPDGSGLELMRRVKAMHRDSKGIAMTGFTSPEDVQACVEAGFERFLPKPVSFSALLTEIGRLLKQDGQAEEVRRGRA
jgi:DNA-binding NtrC family response regulator